MNNPRVNKWLDFFERVIWTAIQAAAAATITVLASDVTWEQGLVFVGIATLAAACKVIIGQHVGADETGSITLTGESPVQPPPESVS
jgi:hypothetical protein